MRSKKPYIINFLIQLKGKTRFFKNIFDMFILKSLYTIHYNKTSIIKQGKLLQPVYVYLPAYK